jgi:Hint domain
VERSSPARRHIFAPPIGLLLALILAAACAGSGANPGPSPTGSPLSTAALKLAVLDGVGGRLDYCDPDQFPIAHGSALEAAQQRLPMIEADRPAFEAILQHLRLSPTPHFADQQLITINDLYKQIQAIQLTPQDGSYRFDLLVPASGPDTGNQRVIGTVTASGKVTIEKRESGQLLNCPICLVRGVLISTPSGDIPVQDVRPGMTVWTTDRHGRRIARVVLQVGSMQAPLGHEVVRVELADGRMVVASPAHPTADGRTVGSLRIGDRVDGSTVVGMALLPYAGTTFDLLPSGPTGTYVADGVLLGSTLSASR